MKDESRLLAFWLLPAPPAQEYFRSLNQELAERYDAPRFEPHLTLYAAVFDDALRADALEQIASRSSMELEISGIDYSDKYTQTLFIRFAKNNSLTELRAAVAEVLGEKDTADFEPHLSLIYQSMPAPEKAELARNLALPFERVLFEGMKVVSTPATIASAEDVQAWKTWWEQGD